MIDYWQWASKENKNDKTLFKKKKNLNTGDSKAKR